MELGWEISSGQLRCQLALSGDLRLLKIWKGRGRETQRERQTDRETDRQTETEKESDRETHRRTDTQTETARERSSEEKLVKQHL